MQLHRPEPSISTWRREPWRILFPCGAAAAWVGVLPWLLLAVGVTEEYRSIQHAMTQVQSFLACFVAGFLFTFVPRRTGCAPPSAMEIATVVLCAGGLAASAWVERWASSQIFWLLWIAVVGRFVLSGINRLRDAASIPASMSWVPVSLVAGVVGAVLTAYGAAQGIAGMWLHDVGRGMVLEGVTTGMVLGVGAFLLPVLLFGQPPDPVRPRVRVVHALAALLFFATFFVGAWEMRAGFALRAVIATAVLLAAGLHRRGANRRAAIASIARIAVWCLPLGFALAALFPEWRKAALHVGFIGGFGLLALAISAHVATSHAGRSVRPAPVRVMSALLLAAIPARALVDLDPERFTLWLGVGAAAFLAGTVAWIAAVLPALMGSTPGDAPADRSLPVRNAPG